MDTINVTVSRVYYPKEPFNDGRERFVSFASSCGKCAGMLAFFPQDGMRLKLVGEWTAYRGEKQFRFSRVMHDTPDDARALLDYAVTLTKGLGESAANKIWKAYGQDWQSHIPEMRPSWSAGLTRTMDTLNANSERLSLIAFMLHCGGTAKMAEAAWVKWKANAIPTITADPYLLATLPGIGFKTVDGKIRDHFGISERDIRRATAAIDYALRTIMDESGNSVVDRDALYRAVDDLRIPRQSASVAMIKLSGAKRIVFCGIDKVTTDDAIRHETDFARYAGSSRDSGYKLVPIWPEGFTPDASQVEAVERAVRTSGLSIINGGAGVGKTTIIKSISETLTANGNRVYLCAFAGKAAARLREATGFDASTIHSMLGWSGEGGGFRSSNLRGVSVILDEASMVPSSLLYEITKRDPERLILVGDQAQLQPVGIGSPFHDAIDGIPEIVSTLTTCYRNKEAVFQSAAKVRNGNVPVSAESKKEKFSVVRFGSAEAMHGEILDRVKNGFIDFSQDIVLSPRNGEGSEPVKGSVAALNNDIMAIVNNHADGEKFKVGDRVMFAKNWPEKDLWNGNTGWISRVDTEGNPYFKTDDGDEVRVSDKEKKQCIVPAYCLTVHKSQGSQYRRVIILVCRRDESRLMDRSMLYTAITRAKEQCIVLCDGGLDRVVNAVRRRKTYLQMLLKGEV